MNKIRGNKYFISPMYIIKFIILNQNKSLTSVTPCKPIDFIKDFGKMFHLI